MRHPVRAAIYLAFAFPLLNPIVARSQALSTARDVFRANIEATGGSDAWERINSLHSMSEMVMEFDQGRMVMSSETWMIDPDHLLTKMNVTEGPPGMPSGETTVYITPDEGWIDGFQDRQQLSSLPSAQTARFRTSMQAKEEVSYLSRPDSLFRLMENRDVDGKRAYVVEIAGTPTVLRLYDRESLLLVAVESPSFFGGGTTTTHYSDYREVNGVMMAHVTSAEFGTQASQRVTVKVIEVNPGLTPERLAELVGQ